MEYEIDDMLFLALEAFEPTEVCSRVQCRYDQEKQCYYVHYWGDDYLVDCRNRKITCRVPQAGRPLGYLPVFLINYLMQVKSISLTGEWISEKDLPGGVTFFRGPHEVPTSLIFSRFGNDLEAFSRVCTQLKGTPVGMADAGFVFNPVPHISLALLYWLGDEEFPAEAKLLFDKSTAGNM
ncbi:MAG: DUF3786 domain-containing protein, partial [Desulfocapsaceae bacterium]|nr:DUF3786 domain-containing protein [Desulfocapsaceae bacterium]